MTRHGMVKTSAAGDPSPATDPHASMVIITADRVAASRVPGRQSRADRNEATCPHPSPHSLAAVAPSQTSAADRNLHSLRLWPAGSFLGDFRTPAGARNSSRMRTVHC